ncbi:hypothetical protein BJV82DRAFT_616469, partial [Fennellomyces sp. T-0311]
MKEKQELNDTTSSSDSGSPPATPPSKPNDNDVDIVPNAIVIKNIPFSIKRDVLVSMLDDEGVPAPYALNYHFDNGIFRGLAFANYRTQDVANAAVHEINRISVSGRRLRAEFKRMLPTAVEKDKNEGKDTVELEGSLRKLVFQNGERQEENISERRRGRSKPETRQFPVATGWDRLDLEDPHVQELISEIRHFKEHSKDKEMIMSNLNGKRRRDAHIIAEELKLGHFAEGVYPVRFMHITKDISDTQKSSLVQERKEDGGREGFRKSM